MSRLDHIRRKIQLQTRVEEINEPRPHPLSQRFSKLKSHFSDEKELTKHRGSDLTEELQHLLPEAGTKDLGADALGFSVERSRPSEAPESAQLSSTDLSVNDLAELSSLKGTEVLGMARLPLQPQV